MSWPVLAHGIVAFADVLLMHRRRQANHTRRTESETYDIYLLPPNEDPETCSSWLRMRNRDGRYNLMFEEWVVDGPFIISPRITFEARSVIVLSQSPFCLCLPVTEQAQGCLYVQQAGVCSTCPRQGRAPVEPPCHARRQSPVAALPPWPASARREGPAVWI